MYLHWSSFRNQLIDYKRLDDYKSSNRTTSVPEWIILTVQPRSKSFLLLFLLPTLSFGRESWERGCKQWIALRSMKTKRWDLFGVALVCWATSQHYQQIVSEAKLSYFWLSLRVGTFGSTDSPAEQPCAVPKTNGRICVLICL